MGDSYSSRSLEQNLGNPLASDANTGSSPCNETLNPKDDQSSTLNGEATTPVCQNCGLHSLLTLQSVPTSSVPSLRNTNFQANSNDLGETGDEDGPVAIVGNAEMNPAKCTRIGRFIKDKEGNKQLVDYEDSAKDDFNFENGEDFVIAISSAYNWSRPELGRPEESLILISPPLAKAYHSVVKDFAGTRLGRLGRSTANITEPYAPLFFYNDEIAKATRNPDFACEEDYAILAGYYSERILPEHDRIKTLLDEGVVQYDDLWALFRPGDLIYSLDEYSEPCLQMLIRTEYRERTRGVERGRKKYNRLVAEMWHISWDHPTGTFGRAIFGRSILPFSGSRSITSLPFYPVKYYKRGALKDIAELQSRLETRGQQWRTLMSEAPRCLKYSGPARKYSAQENEYVSCENALRFPS
jgi:hypothetical protein